MKRIYSVALRRMALVVFAACTVPVSLMAQAPRSAQAPPGCSEGVWTPTPVQRAQSGGLSAPAFHAVYGLSCDGYVYMIRFSNIINGNIIAVDVLGKTQVACVSGTWTSSPVQQAESGDENSPAFHVVWGLACGKNVYMIRFTNKFNGNQIRVDVLGQTPIT